MDRVSLIYKALAGEASTEEMEELEEWVIQSPANREEFEDIKLLWESSGLRERNSDDDLGFEKIKSRVQQRLRTNKRIRQAILLIALTIIALTIGFILRSTKATQSDGVQFNSTPLGEVVKTLEEHYNIKIEVEDAELLNCEFSATFYKVDRQAVLKSIGHALNVEVVPSQKNRYNLKGSGCLRL
jgi:ferric-dicitrate binding protein FerR (iron transport regulator)